MDTYLKRRLERPSEETWPKKFVDPDGNTFVLEKGEEIPAWLREKFEKAKLPLPS